MIDLLSYLIMDCNIADNSFKSKMFTSYNMKQILVNMLLTLNALKEDKITHNPVSDQKSHSFFPPSNSAKEIQVRIHKISALV